MDKKNLGIIPNATPARDYTQERHISVRSSSKIELQAKFERMWLIDSDQFNPLRNCMERERINRSWRLLTENIDPKEKKAVDIGCGSGMLSKKIRDARAEEILAVDIAENALKFLRETDGTGIKTKQDTMPMTSLPDNAYDIVVCTDLIAFLPAQDQRLFFSELARIVKPEGYVLCSSPIDFRTEEGSQKLIELAQTELKITSIKPSYHTLYLMVRKILHVPSLLTKAWENNQLRKQELAQRKGLNYIWFWINTTFLLVWFWYGVKPITNWIDSYLKNSRSALLTLEKISRFLWDEDGISHLIFIGKRRPLVMEEPESPIVRPGKKEIWE